MAAKAARTTSKQSQLQPHLQAKAWLQKQQGRIKNKVNCSLTSRRRLGCKSSKAVSKQSQLQPHFQEKAWLQKQQGPYQNKVNCSLTSRQRSGCKSSKDRIKTKSTTASLPGLAAKAARTVSKQSQLQPHFQAWLGCKSSKDRIKTKSARCSDAANSFHKSLHKLPVKG